MISEKKDWEGRQGIGRNEKTKSWWDDNDVDEKEDEGKKEVEEKEMVEEEDENKEKEEDKVEMED